MKNKQADELRISGLTGADMEIMTKKSITRADVRNALLDDSMGTGANAAKSIGKTIGVLVFSLLLLASGIMLAVLTSYTIFGLIVGIVMIIAAISIPFLGLHQSK